MRKGIRTLAVLATVAAMALSTAAFGQTVDRPMQSSLQVVAGSGSEEPFLVDPGASRVVVDVRQLSPTDRCTITAPSGLPLEMTKVADYPTVGADLSGTGDPLGHFQDVVTWELPEPGEHLLGASDEFVALVRIEGGAMMGFWLEGMRADGSVDPNQPITLWATLHDGLGQPLEDATITVTVRQTGKGSGGITPLPVSGQEETLPFEPGSGGVDPLPSSGGEETLTVEPGSGAIERLPVLAWEETLTLEPDKPGVYTATLAGGVPAGGNYHVSVIGEDEFVRRQLATSFAAWSGAPPSTFGGAAPPPVVATAHDGGHEFEKVEAFPGQVFFGPENRAEPRKPVIVFLHGWNSDTEIWDRPNGGFYHAALEANYRVASVGLHGDRDFMTNAAILNVALPAIAAHYDVKQMVVVAHSKGGVDVDAALMFMDAANYVKTVMTLSTPHFGSPLADLIEELPSWLAGSWQNEGGQSMQLANMMAFRASVANNPNQGRVDFRTFGAWGYDELDPFNAEFIEFAYRDITGPILSEFAGDNDGIVPYASSVRPGGTTIFGGKPDSRTEVNHAQIRKRNNYWRHIQAQLLTSYWDNSPSPPANVTAQLSTTGPDTSNVILNWENRSRFANILRVERSVDGTPFVEIAPPLPIHYPVYVDIGVTPGHTYAYRLRFAIYDQYISDYSAVVSVVYASPIPNPPTNLVATPTSQTTVRLTWQDASSNETGFEIHRKLNVAGANWAHIANAAANAMQWNDSNLNPGTAYAYRVRAVNGTLLSAFSNVAVATTTPLPFGAPSNLAAVYNAATNRVTLTWTDNAGNEDGFALQFAYGSGAWSDLFPATVGPNSTSYVTGTFPPQYGTYQFRVRAFRASETTAWSNVAQAVVTPPPPPTATAPPPPTATPPPPPFGAPSNLAAVYNAATNRVTLTWTDNAGNEDGFALQFAYGSGTWSDLFPATVGPNSTSYVTGTFPPQYGTYQFRVRAFRASGTTAWSNVAQAFVAPPPPPTATSPPPPPPTATPPSQPLVAPSNLAGTYNHAIRAATLTWQDNSSNEDGVQLQMTYVGSGQWTDLNPPTVGPNVTSRVTGSFPVYGHYQFRVRAFRGGTTTAWSNVASVVVIPPIPPTL